MQLKSLFHKKGNEESTSSSANSTNSDLSNVQTPETTAADSSSRSVSPFLKSRTSFVNTNSKPSKSTNDKVNSADAPSHGNFLFGKKRASTMLNLRSGGSATTTHNGGGSASGTIRSGSIVRAKPLERASSMMASSDGRPGMTKAGMNNSQGDIIRPKAVRKVKSSELHKSKKSSSTSISSKAVGALPSIDSVQRKPTIVYNPYGLNNNPNSATQVYSAGISSFLTSSNTTTTNSAMGSRLNSTSSVNNTAVHSNMSINGNANGILPLPMSNPNDYLPKKLHEKCMDLYDEYQFPSASSGKNKKLGDGASASVRTIVCKNHSKSSQIYALKKFQMFKKETPNQFYERCSKEYIIASALSCYPHIVTTSLLVKVPTIQDVSRGWGFVIEYCSKGDLFGLITKSTYKDTVTKLEKFCLFKQVALGVKFLHDNDIVHRDLKPENILIDKQGILKITDFGVSTAGHKTPGDLDSDLKLCNSFVGSPPYVPPEVMLFKHANAATKADKSKWYDPFKMDMWSLGMIFFVLMYQKAPFQEALSSDDEYRKFADSYEQFCHNHMSFRNKNNSEASKNSGDGTTTKHKGDDSTNDKLKKKISGPGIEMQWGKMFWDHNNSLGDDGGASRVAWRLIDPLAGSRSSMKDLFLDAWFLNVEMCGHEMDETILVDRLKTHGMSVGELLIEHEEMMRKLKNNIANGGEDGAHEITVVKEEVEKEVIEEESFLKTSEKEDDDVKQATMNEEHEQDDEQDKENDEQDKEHEEKDKENEEEGKEHEEEGKEEMNDNVNQKTEDTAEENAEICTDIDVAQLGKKQVIKQIMTGLSENNNPYCLGRIKKHSHV